MSMQKAKDKDRSSNLKVRCSSYKSYLPISGPTTQKGSATLAMSDLQIIGIDFTIIHISLKTSKFALFNIMLSEGFEFSHLPTA